VLRRLSRSCLSCIQKPCQHRGNSRCGYSSLSGPLTSPSTGDKLIESSSATGSQVHRIKVRARRRAALRAQQNRATDPHRARAAPLLFSITRYGPRRCPRIVQHHVLLQALQQADSVDRAVLRLDRPGLAASASAWFRLVDGGRFFRGGGLRSREKGARLDFSVLTCQLRVRASASLLFAARSVRHNPLRTRARRRRHGRSIAAVLSRQLTCWRIST
jgi:hypothetical protein